MPFAKAFIIEKGPVFPEVRTVRSWQEASNSAERHLLQSKPLWFQPNVSSRFQIGKALPRGVKVTPGNPKILAKEVSVDKCK